MFPSTARNIVRDPDIERIIALAGEDVDARTLVVHVAIDRPCYCQGQALGPAFAGTTEIITGLP